MKFLKKLFKRSLLAGSMAFTAIILIITLTPLANWMARPLVIDAGRIEKADLIAVLGGGAYKDGSLSRSTNERVITGITLFNKGYAPVILFSGGAHMGTLANKLKHTVLKEASVSPAGIVEAEIMGETALALGVARKAIAVENMSVNTFENIRGIKEYMEREGLKTCIIVTGSTHMKRAALIAAKLGMDFQAAPVKDYTQFRTSPIDRAALFRETLWEYLAIVLYKAHGYI